MGYDGDILDKAFKSARYYFRNKSNVKPEPKERKVYTAVSRDLLEAIDSHIERNIRNANYKPSVGFTEFCTANTDILKEEIIKLNNIQMTDSVTISKKIKKTYKNRYFMLISK